MALRIFEFDDFRLDCDSFELCRDGRSLKLERKPMELLILLAARNGHVVNRSEIAESLWNRDVFVDTEHGINTAVRKIRQVLRDDPDQPRFVQTVPGKGYRFIAPLIEVRPAPGVAENLLSPPPSRSAHSASDRGVSAASIALPISSRVESPASTTRRPSFSVPLLLAALGGMAVLALFVAITIHVHNLRAAAPAIRSLAVLPLDNLSGDPGQEYFADGMTDELTTMLAKSSTLRVISRTSVMQYKGVHRPIREIANALGVDGIIEGSISRTGDKVHMTIQLIQAPSDSHLWAESYDRDARDVVSLPREAAQAIAKRIHSAVPQPASQSYVNPEAHDAYLHGRYLWFVGKNNEAGTYFRKATELQPDYALGWSGLSDYFGQGSYYGNLDPAESLAQEEAAARKAVELDDSLPQAHLSLAAAYFFHQWNWAQADQEISRAIELNPAYAEAYHLRAKLYAAIHRDEEAIQSQRKAMELEPFERPWAMALTYISARQLDAAVNDARLRLAASPKDWGLHGMLFQAYRRQGATKEAAQELETYFSLRDNGIAAENVRHAFEQGGYNAVIHTQLNNLKTNASKQYVCPVCAAGYYAELGDREHTLSLLEEGYRRHAPELLEIQSDPAYDFLHSDERYRSLIRRIGLPPAW